MATVVMLPLLFGVMLVVQMERDLRLDTRYPRVRACMCLRVRASACVEDVCALSGCV